MKACRVKEEFYIFAISPWLEVSCKTIKKKQQSTLCFQKVTIKKVFFLTDTLNSKYLAQTCPHQLLLRYKVRSLNFNRPVDFDNMVTVKIFSQFFSKPDDRNEVKILESVVLNYYVSAGRLTRKHCIFKGSSLPKPSNDQFTFDESDFDTIEFSQPNNRESTPTNSLNIRVELNSGGIQVFDTKPGIRLKYSDSLK